MDLAVPHLRARSVGVYYLVRSLAVAPAAFIGGLLWSRDPALPFVLASGVGLAGTILFAVSVDEDASDRSTETASSRDRGGSP